MKSRPTNEFRVKRVYEEPGPKDGTRVLVDRIWPRGLSKADAAIDHWVQDIAPSTELRRWFAHDPVKWDEFRQRYHAELDRLDSELAALRAMVRTGPVTLVYGARDTEHNNAVALRQYLQGG